MSESKRERLKRERPRGPRRPYSAESVQHRLDTETDLTDAERRTLHIHRAALQRAAADRQNRNHR